MSYEISISQNGKCAVLRVIGVLTHALAIQAATQASHLAEQHHLTRYLIDVREAVHTEMGLANYNFAYEDLPYLGYEKWTHIAILARAGDKSHYLMEAAGWQAGYNLRLFTEEDFALAWLDSSFPSRWKAK